jgi:ATP-dependent helicase/nuclease subunit B
MADRLDLRSDGTAWIIDYKTGGTPSRKEARILLDPQLALEAYALINGGFTDVGRMPVSGLFYLRLTGKEPFAERVDTDPEKPGRDEFLGPDDLAAKAVDEFVKLVTLLRSGKPRLPVARHPAKRARFRRRIRPSGAGCRMADRRGRRWR